jgi:DNA-binding response OmpR family regulator
MANSAKTEATVSELLDKLRNEYVSRLPAELAAINALAASIQPQAPDAIRVDELHRHLHKLAGSGGTFGFDLLSTQARSLEQEVQRWQAQNLSGMNEAAWQRLLSGVAALDGTIHVPDLVNPSLQADVSAVDVVLQYKVWLLADDVQITHELKRQLESFNYVVRVFAQLADAEKAAPGERPDLLLVDTLLAGEDVTRAWSQHAYLLQLGCPLIFISSADDFESRLRASQLGAQGYFLKPLDMPLLISRMVQLFEQRQAPPQRVLIVDDDLVLAEHYRLVLQSAGMEAEVLQQPQQIMEKISAMHPELILMDMHMPQYSGADLAGVIRQYHNWANLPLVYLSAETDIDIQNKALKRGADDFLTKPISDAQLISAVRIRCAYA